MSKPAGGWHGIPPNETPVPQPVSINPDSIDKAAVTKPAAGLPVWAELVFPDGSERRVKAFAQAWTADAVFVQYVDRSLAQYAWIQPSQVQRRALEQWGNRRETQQASTSARASDRYQDPYASRGRSSPDEG